MVSWAALCAAAAHAGSAPEGWPAWLELGTRILAKAKLDVETLDRVRAAAEVAGLLG